MNNLFITIEGMDTTGKTTQARLLKEKLEREGKKVVLMHFPRYNSLIGGYIGEILNDKEKFDKIDKRSLQMLYVADQLDAQNEILQHLAQGYTVILDRYDLSSLAYYTLTNNIYLEDALNIVYNKYQAGFLRPDITFILTLPTNEISKRKNCLDNMEKVKGIENLNNIYSEIPNVIHDHRYFAVIDADNTIEEVHKNMYRYISKF